jgi:hypothetical protein
LSINLSQVRVRVSNVRVRVRISLRNMVSLRVKLSAS